MKTPRWFSHNRVSFLMRFVGAGTLLAGAAAMAFVAVNPSGKLLSGKSNTKSEAKLSAKSLRSGAFGRHLGTLLGPAHEKDAEHNPSDGANQAIYDDQAYPATSIKPAQQQNALKAANAINKLPGGKQSNWQPLGPYGVSADALVASE